MPLFPNASTYYKGRTHTQLVVSEGNAPAEKYIPSAEENYTKFIYEFGPEGNQEVVIPKGKVVALTGLEWDYETEHMVPAIKIANGLAGTAEAPNLDFTGDKIIGVNHHNVYKRIRDRFSGNQPTIITREYIEVPLFTGADADASKLLAKAINFGAAWAATPNDLLGANIAVDEFGNFTVADATNYKSVIGKCLAIETDLPPAGYLQYFMEMEDNEFTQFMRDMSYAPSPGRTKDTRDSAWNDIGTYPEGTGYLKSRKDLIKTFNQGIPFLTDGYFRARTPMTFSTDASATDSITADRIRVSGNLELTLESDGKHVKDIAYKTGKTQEGSAIFLRLPEKLVKDNLQLGLLAENYPEFAGQSPSDVIVKIVDKTALALANAMASATDTEKAAKAEAIAACYKVVGPQDVHVDYTNNQVVVYLDNFYNANYNIATASTDYAIEVTGVVLQNQIPGIPTGWDFKGSVGAARILLK